MSWSSSTRIRITQSSDTAEDWSLVLTAAGIAHRIEEVPDGWRLLVSSWDEERVARELNAVRDEKLDSINAAAPSAEHGRTYAGLIIAAGLVAFYAVTGPRALASEWFVAGSASAARITTGELWRVVTALTLHADTAHVAGNALSCAVFVTAVSRQLGPGVGPAFALLAGALGNGLTAFAYGSQHTSVGASTALFGAIGMLAGLQFADRRRRPLPRPRAWVPIAAGVGLLAMLGTGKNADAAAHLFGFVAGIPLGAAASRAVPAILHGGVQWAAALISFTTLVVCWGVALGWLPPIH